MKLGVYVVLVSLILIAIIGAIISVLRFYVSSSSTVIVELFNIYPTLGLVLLMTVLDQWNRTTMVAFEMKCEAITASLIFCGLGRIIVGYILVTYFEYGVVGVNLSDTICLCSRSMVYLIFIMFCNFKKYKGVEEHK